MASKERFDILFRARDEASGTAKKVTGSLGSVVGGLLSITVAMRALGSVISIGAKFEQTMAGVGGVTRATAMEMKGLTAVARKMGATTEFTANQAAEALRFLGMAGFSANDAISALPGTLDLATAGMLDLGTAADIATNILTSMGLAVSELSLVNDVLIGTTTRSNTTVQMMGESFKFAAPIAAAYGVSIQELSAMIGILANAGLRGGIAGRNLAQSMQKAAQFAQAMGLETTALVDVLEALKERQMDNIEIGKAFGAEQAKIVLVLADSIGEYRDLRDTLGDIDDEAKRLADTIRNTVQGQMDAFTSAVQALQESLFNVNKGPFGNLLRNLTSITRELDKAVRGTTKLEDAEDDLHAAQVILSAAFTGWARAVDDAESGFSIFRMSLLSSEEQVLIWDETITAAQEKVDELKDSILLLSATTLEDLLELWNEGLIDSVQLLERMSELNFPEGTDLKPYIGMSKTSLNIMQDLSAEAASLAGHLTRATKLFENIPPGLDFNELGQGIPREGGPLGSPTIGGAGTSDFDRAAQQRRDEEAADRIKKNAAAERDLRRVEAEAQREIMAEAERSAQELANIIQFGMSDAAVSVLATWDDTRASLEDVFKGMKTDFLQFFLDQIVKDTVAALAKMVKNFETAQAEMADSSAAAAAAADGGGGYGWGMIGYTGFQIVRQLWRGLFGASVGGSSGGASVGGMHPIQQMKQQRGAGVTIIVQGNVIGDEEFVRTRVVPALASLAQVDAIAIGN